MKIVAEVPSEFQGTVVGDLNKRKGVITETDTMQDVTSIEAEVPASALLHPKPPPTLSRLQVFLRGTEMTVTYHIKARREWWRRCAQSRENLGRLSFGTA